MTSSLVGSEMCIRDRSIDMGELVTDSSPVPAAVLPRWLSTMRGTRTCCCLLYTSDAADDM
eukprot:8374547-Prorocentrum_lima.AAC.1